MFKALFQHREEGQSLLIVSLAMVAIVAVVGLVTDAGNAYVQRRMVANAVDAASLAGAVELALTKQSGGRYSGGPQDEIRVLQAAIRVAEANGIPDTNGVANDLYNDNIEVYFLGPTGEQVGVRLPNNGGIPKAYEVSGIKVVANKRFGTFFIGVIGFPEMQAGASADGLAYPSWCPGSASGLFPIAVSTATFSNDPGERPVLGQTYRIWDKNANSSYGNFGWLSWNGDPSNQTLIANMHDTSRSGEWHVGDMIPGAPGVSISSGVRNELDARIQGTPHSHESSVIVPVYDQIEGKGNNLKYRVVGFAKFRLTGYKSQGSDKYIEGIFEEWVNSAGEAGGACYGGHTVKLREPKEPSRDIVGTVHVNEVFIAPGSSSQSHVPVDVMLVLDLSGSMNDSWSGASSKLLSAKDALTRFNAYLQPDKGDRVGLTTFPYIQSAPTYQTVCKGYPGSVTSYNKYLTSRVRSPLTDNIAYVNNIINTLTADDGTSLAHGIQQGRTQLIDDLRPGAVPVLIVASDGIVNVTLDGKVTGFTGNSSQGQNTPDCNNQAEKQTLDQANLAKQQGIHVFSIAMGDGFNTDVTKAIASPDFDVNRNGQIDPNERHFFVAGNDAELAGVYEQIGNRVREITQEGSIRTQETAGYSAVVKLQNVSTGSVRTTVANAAGAFGFENIEPGTYRLTAWVSRNGLTYDLMTDGNGGPPLNPQYIEVQVGQGTGTTEAKTIYLATDDLITP